MALAHSPCPELLLWFPQTRGSAQLCSFMAVPSGQRVAAKGRKSQERRRKGRMRFMYLASSCRGGLWSNSCTSLAAFFFTFFFFILFFWDEAARWVSSESRQDLEVEKRRRSLQKPNHIRVRLHIDDSIKACADYFFLLFFFTQHSLNTLNLALPNMLCKRWDLSFFSWWKI